MTEEEMFFADLFEAREVLRSGDGQHDERAAFVGAPDFFELHAVALGGELLEVGDELVVAKMPGSDLVTYDG